MELKDKISKEQQVEAIKGEIESNEKTSNNLQKAIENNAKVSEAVAALQVLGYNKKEIEKALEKLEKEQLSTEELIKKGLTILGM